MRIVKCFNISPFLFQDPKYTGKYQFIQKKNGAPKVMYLLSSLYISQKRLYDIFRTVTLVQTEISQLWDGLP